MRFCVLFIAVFILSCNAGYCSHWVDFFQSENENNLSDEIVLFNALNLTDEQRVRVREGNENLKKVVVRKQKPKYSMIKRLERQNKKRPHNPDKYYKTNPQLHQFGDPKTIEKCG